MNKQDEFWNKIDEVYSEHYPKDRICIGKIATEWIRFHSEAKRALPKPEIVYGNCHNWSEFTEWLEEWFGVVIDGKN